MRVSAIGGKPRTATLKVSMGCMEGFIGEDMFFYAGPGALRRAQLAKRILEERFRIVKLDAEEIALNRQGRSGDAKADAAVRLAVKLVRERGQVAEADIAAVRAAGLDDGQIVEIVAVTAENIFTNLLNLVAATEIDFPVVHARDAA